MDGSECFGRLPNDCWPGAPNAWAIAQAPRLAGEDAEGRREAALHCVVEATRVQASERGDLVEPVAERVAVDRETIGGGGGGAVLLEEQCQRFEQLELLVQRAEQPPRQVDLGLLVGDT